VGRGRGAQGVRELIQINGITPVVRQLASGLEFAEGPIALPDGSAILVEMRSRSNASLVGGADIQRRCVPLKVFAADFREAKVRDASGVLEDVGGVRPAIQCDT
jgi:hypothetical protein